MVISSKTQVDVYIPLVVGDAKKLVLKNKITNQEYEFPGPTAITGDYYVFSVNFSEFDDGDYVYTAGGDTGVIRIGDYTHSNISYTSDNKNIQYNAFE